MKKAIIFGVVVILFSFFVDAGLFGNRPMVSNYFITNSGNVTSSSSNASLADDAVLGTGPANYLVLWNGTHTVNSSIAHEENGYFKVEGNTNLTNNLYVENTAYVRSSLFVGGNGVGYIGTPGYAGVFTMEGRDVVLSGTEIFTTSLETSYLTNSFPAIYTTRENATGAYPFSIGEQGNLVIQSRSSDSHDIVFATGTTPATRMVINSDGNVGIGTTSPNQALTINGNINFTTYDQGFYFPNFQMEEWSAQRLKYGFSKPASNGFVDFMLGDGDGTDSMMISVFGVGNEEQLTNLEYLRFGYQASGTDRYIFDTEYSGTGQPRPIEFSSGDYGYQLYLNTNGRVGIGTSTPSDKLEVYNGSIYIYYSNNTGGQDGSFFYLGYGGGVANSGMTFYNAKSAAGYGRANIVYGSNDDLTMQNRSDLGAFQGNIFTFMPHAGMSTMGFKMKIGAITGTPSYPLEVLGNTSGVTIWAEGNISAAGYITRTSIYDKSTGKALDKIKDASKYLKDGKIDHEAFYGAVQYEGVDYSRPVEEVFYETDENGKLKPYTKITYPYKTIEYGVDLQQEQNLNRQAIYELKEEVELLKAELCIHSKDYAFC